MIRSETLTSRGRSGHPAELAPFVRQWAALLTTHRRDGRSVGTPVNVVVDGERIVFRTYAQAGKFKRLMNDPRVLVQPCSPRGRVTGSIEVHGVARLLEREDSERAGRMIDAKHPVFQRLLVRLGHRLMRYRTVHFEIVPAEVRAAE